MHFPTFDWPCWQEQNFALAVGVAGLKTNSLLKSLKMAASPAPV